MAASCPVSSRFCAEQGVASLSFYVGLVKEGKKRDMLVYLQMLETEEDRSRFDEMYRKYRNLLKFVAKDILKNEEDAEDAMHQVFLKVAENWDLITEPVCPSTKCLLVTMVENKAIDVYRFKARHQQVPYNDEVVGIVVEYTGESALAKCLAKLPPQYRQIIILKYELKLTNKSIAKLLGTNEVNVRKLEQRARDRLQPLCEKEGLL